MRKLAIAVALSTTVLAGPALARDGAWYVGGDFGATITEDSDQGFTPGQTALPGTVTLGYDEGFDGAGFVGYDLGAFRIEAEVSYKKTDIEDIQSVGIVLPTGAFAGNRRAGGGDVNVLSFMVNGMLDFGDDDGLSGFVGGGVGVARVDYNNVRAFANTGAFLDDSDTRFAWQVIAGLRQAISRNIDVTLKYRFFNVQDLEFVGFGGRAVDADLRSHSLLGGITFNFGGAPVVTPCDPPNFLDANGVCTAPTPTPTGPPPCEANSHYDPATGGCVPDYVAPPMVNCVGGTQVPQGTPCPTVGPWIVYFGWDQDDLTADARATLDQVAATWRGGGNAAVTLAGHADRSGSDAYNVGLSQRRANNVRDYLAAQGVGSGSITTQAFGESQPRVDTADGVREPQNRRVEISFGPGSGW